MHVERPARVKSGHENRAYHLARAWSCARKPRRVCVTQEPDERDIEYKRDERL
jgi:hypothetical protein